MTKTKLSMGVLLMSGLFLFGCSSKPGASTPGAAGTSGGAGTSGQAGTTGNMDASTNPATLPNGHCVSGAYPRDGIGCMCLSNVPNVCVDKCTDIRTDNDNCGACGTKCDANASCNAGKCGPVPVVVVPAAAGCTSLHIAVGGTSLYWTDEGHGTVKSMPLAGGAGATVAMAETTPTSLVVAGTTVFWLSGKMIRKSTAGAAATTVVTSPDPINGFTASVDGATVYFSALTKVMQVPAAGGAAVVVASEEHAGVPGALALDGTTLVYPCDINGDVDVVELAAGKVSSCGAEDDAGALVQVMCTRIARSQGSLFLGSILATGHRAYWADNPTIKGGDSTPGAAQSNDSIASTASTNGSISALTNSGTTLLFAEYDKAMPATSGYIDKAPLVKDSTTIILARAQNAPGSIAADTTKVYWSTGDCKIMSTLLQ
jgi:membrane-bound inhibitor of C-type lysozyme